MSYYWYIRQELMKKAKEKCRSCGGKEKTAEYYQTDKDAIKQKENDKYKNLTEEEKEAKRKHSNNRDKKMKENQAKL